MTAQVPEVLIYEGERVAMACCPPIPGDHPRIRSLVPDPAKGADSLEVKLFELMKMDRTDCLRGYVGLWKIENGRFYFLGASPLWEVVGDEPLLADWFSGKIRIPKGEMLFYVHMGFGSVYEEEIQITIEKGVVTGTRLVDNRPRFAGDRSPGERFLEHRRLVDENIFRGLSCPDDRDRGCPDDCPDDEDGDTEP